MGFSKCVCKAVVCRQLRRRCNYLLGTQHAFSRQVDNLEPTFEHRAFLRLSEFQKLLFKQSVGNQDLVGPLQEDVEQGHLPEVYETTAVTDNDPHVAFAALSNPTQPRATAAAKVLQLCLLQSFLPPDFGNRGDQIGAHAPTCRAYPVPQAARAPGYASRAQSSEMHT